MVIVVPTAEIVIMGVMREAVMIVMMIVVVMMITIEIMMPAGMRKAGAEGRMRKTRMRTAAAGERGIEYQRRAEHNHGRCQECPVGDQAHAALSAVAA